MAEVLNSSNWTSGAQSGKVGGEGVDPVGDVDLVGVVGIRNAVEQCRDYGVVVKVTKHLGGSSQGVTFIEQCLKRLTKLITSFFQ